MIFDVLESSVSFSKWGEGKASLTLNFEVVPKGSEYIDIGDQYILCASGYQLMYDKDRQAVSAAVTVCTDPGLLDHVKGKKPFCGFAVCSPESQGDFHYAPAYLGMIVVVEPHELNEMLKIRITEPGTATLHLMIEGLKFGGAPDGTHQIWKLDDDSDCGLATERRITSFSCNVETFSTSERSIIEEKDRRFHKRLAESPNPEERKIAASLQPQQKADPVAQLLRQCRALLTAIFGLGVLVFLKLNR